MGERKTALFRVLVVTILLILIYFNLRLDKVFMIMTNIDKIIFDTSKSIAIPSKITANTDEKHFTNS